MRRLPTYKKNYDQNKFSLRQDENTTEYWKVLASNNKKSCERENQICKTIIGLRK